MALIRIQKVAPGVGIMLKRHDDKDSKIGAENRVYGACIACGLEPGTQQLWYRSGKGVEVVRPPGKRVMRLLSATHLNGRIFPYYYGVEQANVNLHTRSYDIRLMANSAQLPPAAQIVHAFAPIRAFASAIRSRTRTVQAVLWSSIPLPAHSPSFRYRVPTHRCLRWSSV